MILWILSLFAIGFFTLYLWLRTKYNKSPLPGLPTPPNPHWLIGHVEDRTIDIDRSLKQICADHANGSGVTAMWYFGAPTVTVLRYQDARSILQSTPNRMSIPALIRKQMDMLTGPRNILLLEGREWKFHRQAIVRALGRTTMDKAKTITVQVSLELAETLSGKIADKGDIEIGLRPLMHMLALDVFGLSAIGYEFRNCQTLELHPVALAYQYMSREYDRRMKNPFMGYFYGTPTKNNKHYMTNRKMVRTFIEGRVQERVAEGSNNFGDDFLGHLLLAREDLKESQGLQRSDVVEETITDILLTILFAGQDTTSLSLVYTILEVAKHPEVERKCLEEIKAVWEDESHLPNPMDLCYCSAVIKEALRLFPPVPGMARTLTKPVRVGKGADEYELPVGTYTYMPFWLIHRDERNFERALEFVPERWVEQSADGTWKERNSKKTDGPACSEASQGNEDAFFAFSTGGRSCAGQKFAEQETVLAIATLLRKLRFRWKEGYELHVLHSSNVQKPSDDVPVVVSMR